MDGDLQHDPEEILFIAKLAEGYDIVSGWRAAGGTGGDAPTAGRVANWMMAKLSGVPLLFRDDFQGLSAKSFRIFHSGDLHRFIPALATWSGAQLQAIKNPPAGPASLTTVFENVPCHPRPLEHSFARLLDKALHAFGFFGLLATGTEV
jgi:hypothetical protein